MSIYAQDCQVIESHRVLIVDARNEARNTFLLRVQMILVQLYKNDVPFDRNTHVRAFLFMQMLCKDV
jgi:hypothetical protein